MKPGRELDALVAEKVMGIESVRLVDETVDKDREWFALVSDGEPRRRAGMFGLHSGYWEVQRYSTGIAAAWEVVEKLRERGLDTWLYTDNYGANRKVWCCYTGDSDPLWDFEEPMGSAMGNLIDATHEAATAPHAICLAALKAVE
jgi:hypothetical protein